MIEKSRSERPRYISTESRTRVVSLASMKPKYLGYPYEIWTRKLLAELIRENCIKEKHPDLSKICQGTISKIHNSSKIKPFKVRYYVAKVDLNFD